MPACNRRQAASDNDDACSGQHHARVQATAGLVFTTHFRHLASFARHTPVCCNLGSEVAPEFSGLILVCHVRHGKFLLGKSEKVAICAASLHLCGEL